MTRQDTKMAIEPGAMKILFYADTRVFGGHDIGSLAACNAIRECFPQVEILWLVSDDNERMLQRLEQEGYRYSFLSSTPRYRLLKNPVAVLAAVMANARKIRRLAPHVVVVAQGIVTFSFLGSLAARMAGVPHCCYLPLGALASECDGQGGSRLLDTLWRLCFRHTNNYITIDEEQKRLISLYHPEAKIKIVEVYVAPREISGGLRDQSRHEWAISGDRQVIGVVGRIAFAQKNQDWLIHQLAADSFWKDYLLLLVGDGPDSARLAEMIRQLKLEARVRMLGWIKSLDPLYAAIDLLLIPSRSEGVPAVMLEALSQRVPVVGTNRDGMKLWLPQEWRFEAGDAEGMKRAVLAAKQPAGSEFWRVTDAHLKYIQDRRRYGTEFLAAIHSFT